MPLLAQKKYTGTFVFTPQWTAHAQFAGYYVAQEKGFYKAEGLDVDIVHPSVSETAMHRIQEAESHATTLPLCLAMEIMDKGVPLVNILQTSMNNSTVIVSRRGKNPLTQKGARVGIWHAGFGQVAICMSRKEHLNYQWIQFTSNFDLFIKGAIDATLAMSYNEYYQLMQMGFTFTKDNVYRFSDHGYNIQDDGLYMRRDYYETHKAKVQQNHVTTNRTLQRLMLKEILRLQVDRDSKKREFRLRPEMVKKANMLMRSNGMLKRDITYKELLDR